MSAYSRQRSTPRPLDAARLNDLALAYVARFAVTTAKLEGYLERKLRERGWGGDGPPPVADILARFVAAGYVDDAAFARMKAEALQRRGYGQRRVDQTLDAAGIEPHDRAAARLGEGAQRAAALVFARRRRLGPFGPAADRDGRQKQLAALLRAGHRTDLARALLDATDPAAAEAWAAEETDR